MLVHTDDVLVKCCYGFGKTIFIILNTTKNFLLQIWSALNIPEKHAAWVILLTDVFTGSIGGIMLELLLGSWQIFSQVVCWILQRACLADSASSSPAQGIHTSLAPVTSEIRLSQQQLAAFFCLWLASELSVIPVCNRKTHQKILKCLTNIKCSKSRICFSAGVCILMPGYWQQIDEKHN